MNLEYLAPGGLPQSAGRGLPGFGGRHRFPHHHDQRPGRARLGRGRHRGRGLHARTAGLHAAAAGGRVQAERPAAGRLHGDRPGADRHPDAAQEGRGRQVRRVLRRRPERAEPGGSRHGRQHGARVRRHDGLLPGGPGDARVTSNSPTATPDLVALVEAYTKEQGLFRTDDTPDPVYRRHAGTGSGDRDAVDGRAEASAGSRRTARREEEFPRPRSPTPLAAVDGAIRHGQRRGGDRGHHQLHQHLQPAA